jgi:predicted glycosyltransferase
VLVDDRYFEETKKEERILFFLGDADYEKVVLNNEAFFKSFDMDLLLGNYFFVKYEDALAKLFSTLHEPEEYTELIKSSASVVTASAQTALEAKASGAKVIFVHTDKALYPVSLLSAYGIDIVEGFDAESVNEYLQNNLSTEAKNIDKIDDKKILLKQ